MMAKNVASKINLALRNYDFCCNNDDAKSSDVSEPIVETLTDSDWVPKLGPDFKVRET